MFYGWGQTSIISPPCVTDSRELLICRFRGRHIRRLHVRVAAMRTALYSSFDFTFKCVRGQYEHIQFFFKHGLILTVTTNELKSNISLFLFFYSHYCQLPSPPPGWWRAGGIHGNLAVCWRRTPGAPCWPAPWTSVVRFPSAGAAIGESGGYTDCGGGKQTKHKYCCLLPADVKVLFADGSNVRTVCQSRWKPLFDAMQVVNYH